MKKAVFLDAGSLHPDDLDMSSLTSLPVTLTCFDTTADDDRVKRIANAHIILTNKVNLPRRVLAQAPHCRYIGITATGMNNVDLAYCRENGITVTNVAGYGTESVAQHTLMLLLNLATRFSAYQRNIRAGDWSRAAHFCLLDHPVTELSGKQAVIVGYGTLGQRVAELYEALGMRVVVAARPGKKGDSRPSLSSLVPDADVVSLHCQLSSDTAKMIDATLLSRMKPSCLLINTARGGLIDEPALVDALKSETIGGAALDGLSAEPPPADHVLLNYQADNLIITPHNAWVAKASRQRLLDGVASNIAAWLGQHE